MELSVIVPVYNEADNVGSLLSELYRHLFGIQFELIIVDDHSTDSTLKNAIRLKEDNTRIIAFDKNYGQSAAIKAGIDNAKGQYIALIDGDLQNDPSDIVKAYRLIQLGDVDMVQGYRINRHDSLSKKIPSAVANFFIRKLFDIGLHDVGCSLKMFKRSIWASLIQFNGFHRYLPLIASIRGFAVVEVEVNHSPRLAGQSKYGIGRVFPVLWDLLCLRIAPQKRAKSLHYAIERVYV